MGSLVPLGPVPAFAGRHYQFQVPPGAGPPGPFLAGGACPAPMRIGVSFRGCRWLPGVSLAAAGASWAPSVPLRMRRPGGGCLSPAALAAAGPGDDGLSFRIVKTLAKPCVSLHSRCCPAVALAKRGVARAGSGAAVPPLAGACITWALSSFHDRNLVGRICLLMVMAQLLPESYTGWSSPYRLSRSTGEPKSRASIQTSGMAPGTLPHNCSH